MASFHFFHHRKHQEEWSRRGLVRSYLSAPTSPFLFPSFFLPPVNGKIVEVDDSEPAPRQQNQDSSRFFTQQGGSSATMQQWPGQPAQPQRPGSFFSSIFKKKKKNEKATHPFLGGGQEQAGGGGNFTDVFFEDTVVLGNQIKVWHGVLAIAALVYLLGPMGLLAAGGVYYYSQQQQQQQQQQQGNSESSERDGKKHEN